MSVDRRSFLRTSLAGAPLLLGSCVRTQLPPPAADPTAFEFNELTIRDLQAAMQSGRLTARRLCEAYLQRIAALDRQGPELRAVIEINPDAVAIAQELDRERAERGPRSPLHGIPVLLKDNLDTADRMTTTAGSLALEGWTPPEDADVVRRLRQAGAVLLGKTNLSEWANFRSQYSTSGWSARGGQCRNPYALDRNPCGSSSGSAVAVSANLCAVAVGTETDGSIVCPANATGIVGVKPTLGLVSRRGIIPIAHSQDTAGPMTRTVEDAAILLGIMAGSDPGDSATAEADRRRTDYTAALDGDALRGARIGVARQFFGFLPAVDEVMRQVLQALSDLGAELVDPVELATFRKFGDAEYQVLLYEFKYDLNRYLSRLPAEFRVHTLADLIRFNQEHAEQEMPHFGQDIFLEAEAKGGLDSLEYRDALALCRRLSREEGLDAVLQAHRLDALVAPTGSPAWKIDPVNGDHFLGGSSSYAAVAGYPSVCIPAGFVAGLPVGVSLVGGPWSEARLLALAYALEQGLKARRPPRFLE
jgi:amidase